MSGGLAGLVIVPMRDLITTIAAKGGRGFLGQTFVLDWWVSAASVMEVNGTSPNPHFDY